MNDSPHTATTAPSIALFLPTTRGGGAERNFLRLAGGLRDRGYDVTVVVADTRGPNRTWVPDGVELVDLRMWLLPLSLFPLARFLRRRRPDVLLSALNGANVVALAARMLARTAVPMVVTERNTLSQWRADARTIRRRWIIPWLVRRLYPRAERVVGVSQGVADDLAEFTGIERARIDAIPNPVVDEQLAERAAGQAQDAEVVADGPVVVSVGRLVPHKDHPTLLRAFAKTRGEIPGAQLVVLGDGPARRSIERQVSELGLDDAVHLLGFLDNPYAWMARSQVLAMSSRYEGLPTVIIEALACGARVVATDCPSGSAEILEHGRWGWLVDIGDVDGFATALTAALRAGRWPAPPDEALDRYRPDAVLDAYEQLIAPLLARP